MASKKIITTLVVVGMIALIGGCGSDDDNDPVAPPVDTAPPALPGGLAVDYAADQHVATVTWDANVTDDDLAGYLVSRGAYDFDPQVLVDTPQAATVYQDALEEACGRQVTYYIYSVDTSDNVSAAATVTLQLPEPPAPSSPDQDRGSL